MIRNNVGMFLNGFLYWQALHNETLLIFALDIKKMILSHINIPGECNFGLYLYTRDRSHLSYYAASLGELYERLCMISKRNGHMVVVRYLIYG